MKASIVVRNGGFFNVTCDYLTTIERFYKDLIVA
jgi:hypothetical protein